MKITFVEKAHTVTELAHLGETLRQSPDPKLSTLAEAYYEFIGRVLKPGQGQDLFAVLQRHDLDDGEYFFVIAAEVDGQSALIHLDPPADNSPKAVKSQLWDRFGQRLRGGRMVVLPDDAPSIADPDVLEVYLTSSWMEVKDV